MEHCAQEGEPCPELLSLLLNCLYALDSLDKPLAQVKAVFELRLLCLLGYEPMLEGCVVCGAAQPLHPRLNLSQGVLHCQSCAGQAGRGVSMPLNPAALAAARHIAGDGGKKLFSFALDPGSLTMLGDAAEAFLMTQLERGWRTLDYYKQILSLT